MLITSWDVREAEKGLDVSKEKKTKQNKKLIYTQRMTTTLEAKRPWGK